MINFDIDVDTSDEAMAVRDWLLQEGIPFKPNSITIYNKETTETSFYNTSESEFVKGDYYIYQEVD